MNKYTKEEAAALCDELNGMIRGFIEEHPGMGMYGAIVFDPDTMEGHEVPTAVSMNATKDTIIRFIPALQMLEENLRQTVASEPMLMLMALREAMREETTEHNCESCDESGTCTLPMAEAYREGQGTMEERCAAASMEIPPELRSMFTSGGEPIAKEGETSLGQNPENLGPPPGNQDQG